MNRQEIFNKAVSGVIQQGVRRLGTVTVAIAECMEGNAQSDTYFPIRSMSQTWTMEAVCQLGSFEPTMATYHS